MNTFRTGFLLLVMSLFGLLGLADTVVAQAALDSASTQFLFVQLDLNHSSSDIYLGNVTGQMQKLTHAQQEQYFSMPDWSADKKKIAFIMSDASGSCGLYIMNADGTNIDQITSLIDNQCDFSPKWSPDGSKIAFLRQTNPKGPVTLLFFDLQGGHEITLDTNVDPETLLWKDKDHVYDGNYPDGSYSRLIDVRTGESQLVPNIWLQEGVVPLPSGYTTDATFTDVIWDNDHHFAAIVELREGQPNTYDQATLVITNDQGKVLFRIPNGSQPAW